MVLLLVYPKPPTAFLQKVFVEICLTENEEGKLMLRLGGDGKPKRLEVRLSIVDQKLGNAAKSNDHMKRGQQQYFALGRKFPRRIFELLSHTTTR